MSTKNLWKFRKRGLVYGLHPLSQTGNQGQFVRGHFGRLRRRPGCGRGFLELHRNRGPARVTALLGGLERLLEADTALTPAHRRYLVAAAMLGHVARGGGGIDRACLACHSR